MVTLSVRTSKQIHVILSRLSAVNKKFQNVQNFKKDYLHHNLDRYLKFKLELGF